MAPHQSLSRRLFMYVPRRTSLRVSHRSVGIPAVRTPCMSSRAFWEMSGAHPYNARLCASVPTCDSGALRSVLDQFLVQDLLLIDLLGRVSRTPPPECQTARRYYTTKSVSIPPRQPERLCGAIPNAFVSPQAS